MISQRPMCGYSEMETGLLEKSIADLAAGFENAFEAAWARYAILQGAEKKGTLNTIWISYLRTGVLMDTAWLQIDLLDEGGWGALEECCTDWDIRPAVASIYESAQRKYGQTEAEREKQLLDKAEQFIGMLKKHLPTIIQTVREEYPQVQFRFGEYMGTSQTI